MFSCLEVGYVPPFDPTRISSVKAVRCNLQTDSPKRLSNVNSTIDGGSEHANCLLESPVSSSTECSTALSEHNSIDEPAASGEIELVHAQPVLKRARIYRSKKFVKQNSTKTQQASHSDSNKSVFGGRVRRRAIFVDGVAYRYITRKVRNS